MEAAKVRIRSGVAIDFVYRDPDEGLSAQVDCRLLFMGANFFAVRRAYAEAIRLFEGGHSRAELSKRLAESPEIQRHYESVERDGKVSITMREATFREPGPLAGIEFSLRITRGVRAHLYPLALERFAALGNLMPLLEGGRSEVEIRETLARRVYRPNDCAWAEEFIGWLKRENLLEADRDGGDRSWLARERPRITFLGHSTLLMQSERSAVLLDPIVNRKMGSPRKALGIFRAKLDAICCTHSHWDHCNPETLLRLDKDVPILIPAVARPSALNPPMVSLLKRLGFSDIREVKILEQVTVGDIEIVPAPFHGEPDEPGAEIDHYTYVIRSDGMTVYGGVDSYRDEWGDMRPVLERVEREYHPDVVFLPVSRVVYHYREGSLNQFCRYVDEDLVPRVVSVHGGSRGGGAVVAIDARRSAGAVRHVRLHALGGSRTGDAVRCGVERDWRGRSLLSAAAIGFDCDAGPGAGGTIAGTAAPVVIMASRDFRAAARGPNQWFFPRVRRDFPRNARWQALPRQEF